MTAGDPRTASAPRGRRAAPRQGETSAEAVARHIRMLVFDGKLAPGQRVPQDAVARDVGVSRIPVREAIIALEREGWVRVEPHRGAFVNALDEQAIDDWFALYGRYYGFAARRAIERMTSDDLAPLAALADAVARARTAATVQTANRRYLAALVHLAASSRLQAVLRSTTQVVPGNFFAAVPGSIGIQQAGIARVQAAIAAGDPADAEAEFAAIEADHARAVIAMLQARTGGGA